MYGLVKDTARVGYDLKEDLAKPTLSDDKQVIIKCKYVAICGSDIPLYKYDEVGRSICTLPFTPGHEVAGVVVEAGATSGFSVGDHVAVETHIPCEDCYCCRDERGLKGICADMGMFGHGGKTQHGGLAEYCLADSRYVFRLDQSIPLQVGAMFEPFGVAHNAVEEAKVTAASEVLVTGCGPIGLFCVELLIKVFKVAKVVVMDIAEDRLKAAITAGAHAGIKSLDEVSSVLPDGPSTIIECSGAPPVVNRCFQSCRKGGTVVFVGLPKAPLHVDTPIQNFLLRCLTVRSVHGRKIFHTWQSVHDLVTSKQVDLQQFITHTYSIDQFDEAMDMLMSGTAVKVLIDVEGRKKRKR